jgi:hypothetical protein
MYTPYGHPCTPYTTYAVHAVWPPAPCHPVSRLSQQTQPDTVYRHVSASKARHRRPYLHAYAVWPRAYTGPGAETCAVRPREGRRHMSGPRVPALRRRHMSGPRVPALKAAAGPGGEGIQGHEEATRCAYACMPYGHVPMRAP